MTALDPKAAAQTKFAQPDALVQGIDIIGRYATDPPITVRTILDTVAERAGAGSRVIELGFGSGWLLEELPAAVPEAVLYGLDLSPGNATRAHGLYGGSVCILIGDMERLPFADFTLDVIVTCWTLYFMRDLDATLREFTRCIRPGGRLIAATSARDHEIEAEELVAEAVRMVLGHGPAEPDVSRQFDLESGRAPLERHFPRVAVREWHGEMVLGELDLVLALWPKWQPASLDDDESTLVRAQFARLAEERLRQDGELRIRRHECAFICDLA
jgi:SAM-dependent methyltransferase